MDDRGLGPPRPVEVLRLEHGDVAVAERHVHDRQRTRCIGDAVVARRDDLPGDVVPALMWGLRSVDARNIRAILWPLWAADGTNRLYFVVVLRVVVAVETGRWWSAELRRALDAVRLHVLPVVERATRRRTAGRLLPLVGSGARRRPEEGRCRAIASPSRDHGGSGGFAGGNAVCLALTIGHCGERRFPLFEQGGGLGREQPCQHAVRRRDRGGLRICAGTCSERRGKVRLVLAGNGVDGLES